jgi:hypothetical protein
VRPPAPALHIPREQVREHAHVVAAEGVARQYVGAWNAGARQQRAYIQASVSPSLSIQAVARHRDVEHGDIRLNVLNVDLDDFKEETRRSLISDSVTVRRALLSRPALRRVLRFSSS